MIYKNLDAYHQLKSESIKIRDTFIDQMSFSLTENGKKITLILVCKVKQKKITLELTNIKKMEFSFFPDDPDYLEEFKLIYLDNDQQYYFSMDPDYSSPYPILSDCNNIIFSDLIVTV